MSRSSVHVQPSHAYSRGCNIQDTNFTPSCDEPDFDSPSFRPTHTHTRVHDTDSLLLLLLLHLPPRSVCLAACAHAKPCIGRSAPSMPRIRPLVSASQHRHRPCDYLTTHNAETIPSDNRARTAAVPPVVWLLVSCCKQVAWRQAWRESLVTHRRDHDAPLEALVTRPLMVSWGRPHVCRLAPSRSMITSNIVKLRAEEMPVLITAGALPLPLGCVCVCVRVHTYMCLRVQK